MNQCSFIEVDIKKCVEIVNSINGEKKGTLLTSKGGAIGLPIEVMETIEDYPSIIILT